MTREEYIKAILRAARLPHSVKRRLRADLLTDVNARLDSGETIPNGELTYLPYRGRSYAYLSDTLPSARAAGLVGGVDLLYHEATFAAGDKALARQTGHSTTVQAAQVAEKAGARRLLIGHFSSRYKDESLLVEEARGIFAAAEAAVEGASYEIPLKREP